jgi:peptidoglycan hydrolase-like protein with peptidoglycan-binding domain
MRNLLLAMAFLPGIAWAQNPDPYVEFIKRVQVALHLQGFDPGPVNGRDDGATQAALAQFQLSRNLPASGSVDEETLRALGVSREKVAQAVEGEAESDGNASAGAGMPLARP